MESKKINNSTYEFLSKQCESFGISAAFFSTGVLCFKNQNELIPGFGLVSGGVLSILAIIMFFVAVQQAQNHFSESSIIANRVRFAFLGIVYTVTISSVALSLAMNSSG